MGGVIQSGTFEQYPNDRYEGQIDTLEVGNNIGHAFVEGSDVAFGLAVTQGTADNQVTLATATGNTFRGVSVRNLSIDNSDTSGLAAYKSGQAITYRNFGSIVVVAEVAVSKDDDVFFRHTASGGNTTLGAFRNDADAATADPVTGAYFSESAVIGELVRITLTTIF